MITIYNKTNSPIDIPGAGKSFMVPAFGELSGEFDPAYVELLKLTGAVRIDESGAAKPQQEKPPAPPAPKQPPAPAAQAPSGDVELRKEYAELMGKPAPSAWNKKKLIAEIKKLKEG